VSLVAPEILRVFATFVEDVAMSAAAENDDAGAIRAFAARFAHWRRLLAGEPRGGLSQAEAQGLWGELWILRQVLHPTLGDEAVDAWTGQDRDAKDFRWRDVSVEVKTTRADAPHLVRINGEHQLEDDGEVLVLAVLDVDSHQQGGGETLNDAVRDSRALMAGARLQTLDEKLVDYGYFDADRDLYESRRYVLRRTLWHKVDPGFPRLVSGDLPEGVGRVTYLLSIDAAAAWRINDDGLASLLAGAMKHEA
jgi:hypothetical protein